MHRFHPDPARDDHPDAIVFDDCPDCVWRAEHGIEGLLLWDTEHFDALWNRMLDTEYKDREPRRNETEQKTCRILYLLGVLMERHFPEERPWERRGSTRSQDV